MKRKKIAYIWIVVCCLSCLFGCTTQKQTDEVVSLPQNYDGLISYLENQSSMKEVTCWYTSKTDEKWLKSCKKQFEDAYHIKVNLVYYDGVNLFEDMNQANQKGTGPDLYLIGNDQLELAVKSGMSQENVYLSDAMWKKHYPEVAKKAVTYQKKVYGYPIYFDTYCLVYDANLLEHAPASIDDIMEFADAYEDTGSTKAIFRWDVADPYINTMFLASYADLFGENGDNSHSFSVNSEKCISAMEYFQSLSAYLWMNKNNISHDTIKNRIKEGTLVLGLCKTDILPTLYEMQKKASGETQEDLGEEQEADEEADVSKKVEDTNYQISYVPSLTSELSSTTLSTTYAAFVNPYGQENALGNMFALYLSLGQKQSLYEWNGKISVCVDDLLLDELQSIIYAQYRNSQPVPKVMVLGDYLSESGIAFDEIWSGKDVKEQLEQLQTKMQEKLP